MADANLPKSNADSERVFRFVSYSVVLSGFVALFAAGAFSSIALGLFFVLAFLAWKLERLGRQMSERIGTALTVLALPVFYILWKFGFFAAGPSETVLPAVLAKLIVFLAIIKLFQKKTDRDWIFLYVMSFFEVLLAAGLSISSTYILSFLVFIFFFTCSVIAFEIRRTRRYVQKAINLPDDSLPAQNFRDSRRIPAVALVLIGFVIITALPIFFLIPRVGSASGGRETGGVSTRSGFSDSVKLGGIGRIQQNDEVVMRIRIEGKAPPEGLRWRGQAFDVFDGQAWSKSRPGVKEVRTRGDKDIIQVDYASGRDSLLVQTVYAEPIDTPVIFAAPRVIGFQGNLSVLLKDDENAISLQRSGERLSYKAISDVSLPSFAALRADTGPYSPAYQKYLRLPETFDPRISALAANVTAASRNRLDAALAIEDYLRANYGYTLDLKAGGEDPLADFLFNVREGHCEYFATAMAMMLRSLGIATRLAAGFQRGDYNDAADVFVVRQRHAHAWVEVYFPDNDVWVPFDPTPAAASEVSSAYGAQISRNLRKYLDAAEMFWIQYFVAFDNQEQRSLFSNTGRTIAALRSDLAVRLDSLRISLAEFWQRLTGRDGFREAAYSAGKLLLVAAAAVIFVVAFVFVRRRLVKSKVWTKLRRRLLKRGREAGIDFYERLLEVLATAGFRRQPFETPLEFAFSTNLAEAVEITDTYNRVRFGRRRLSDEETERIAELLKMIEARLKAGRKL